MNIRTRGSATEPAIHFNQNEVQEREAAFLEYVQVKIEEVKKYTRLGKDGMLSFFDLNQAMSEFQNINMSLIAVYSFTKNDFVKAQEEFEDWYAQKYEIVREIENPKSVSPGKWASAKEIEMLVRVKFADEFQSKKHELNLQETQLSFIRRLCDAWASQQFILSQLSKNLIAEIGGLNVESR